MALAEVLSEDLAAASRDPVHAGVAQTRGRIRIAELRAIGEEDEFGDRERVELDAVGIAVANRGEQVAVVVERQPRIEAPVEADEIAADLEQLVDLREHILTAQDVAALLVREDVERAIVALRHADVRVIDDPHHHVGGAARVVVARADDLRETFQPVVVCLVPQPRSVGNCNPAARLDLGGDLVHAGTASSSVTSSGASVSMNELTEKTALPAPATP
jgi:hypothetical protein